MSIQFTQIKRSSGYRLPIRMERPEEIEIKARGLQKMGLRFQIEMLSTGEVSMTIEDDETIVAHEVCANGPEVPLAVDDLINDAWHKVEEACL